MFDHSTGSIGNAGLMPDDPNNAGFQSLGGMHHFGGTNSHMAGVRNMFGADAQMYYGHSDSSPTMQDFKTNEHTTANLGVSNYLQRSILGKSYSIGQNSTSMDLAYKEQQALLKANLGMDLVEMGSAAAGGLAMTIGGPAGAVIGTAAMGVSMGIGTIRDTYMENYRNTSEIAGITNSFIGKDGKRGLGKSDNADFTKFLGAEAAADPLMNLQDMMNVVAMGSDGGMYANDSTALDAKRTTKKLTKTLKMLGDIMGSSDMKAMMSEVKKYNQLGFSMGDTVNTINKMSTTSDLAGMSKRDSNDVMNAALQMAPSRSSSAQSISEEVILSMTDMGVVQQMKGGSGRLSNKRAYMSASNGLNVHAEKAVNQRYSISSDKKKVYANYLEEKTGEDAQEALASLEKMSIKDQKTTMSNVSRDDYSSAAINYRQTMANDKLASNKVASDKKISSLKTKDSASVFIQSIIDMKKENKKDVSYSSIMVDAMQQVGELDSTEHELLSNTVKIELSPFLKNKRKNSRKVAEQVADRRSLDIEVDRERDLHSFHGSVGIGWDTFTDKMRSSVSGFYSAGKINDLAQQAYGNTGIKSESAIRHVSGSTLSGVDPFDTFSKAKNTISDIVSNDKVNRLYQSNKKDFERVDTKRGRVNGENLKFMGFIDFMDGKLDPEHKARALRDSDSFITGGFTDVKAARFDTWEAGNIARESLSEISTMSKRDKDKTYLLADSVQKETGKPHLAALAYAAQVTLGKEDSYLDNSEEHAKEFKTFDTKSIIERSDFKDKSKIEFLQKEAEEKSISISDRDLGKYSTNRKYQAIAEIRDDISKGDMSSGQLHEKATYLNLNAKDVEEIALNTFNAGSDERKKSLKVADHLSNDNYGVDSIDYDELDAFHESSAEFKQKANDYFDKIDDARYFRKKDDPTGERSQKVRDELYRVGDSDLDVHERSAEMKEILENTELSEKKRMAMLDAGMKYNTALDIGAGYTGFESTLHEETIQARRFNKGIAAEEYMGKVEEGLEASLRHKDGSKTTSTERDELMEILTISDEKERDNKLKLYRNVNDFGSDFRDNVSRELTAAARDTVGEEMMVEAEKKNQEKVEAGKDIPTLQLTEMTVMNKHLTEIGRKLS